MSPRLGRQDNGPSLHNYLGPVYSSVSRVLRRVVSRRPWCSFVTNDYSFHTANEFSISGFHTKDHIPVELNLTDEGVMQQ